MTVTNCEATLILPSNYFAVKVEDLDSIYRESEAASESAKISLLSKEPPLKLTKKQLKSAGLLTELTKKGNGGKKTKRNVRPEQVERLEKVERRELFTVGGSREYFTFSAVSDFRETFLQFFTESFEKSVEKQFNNNCDMFGLLVPASQAEFHGLNLGN